MYTKEQKAWQIHEYNVSYAELCMIVEDHACALDNLTGTQGFTLDDAIEVKWQEIFGQRAE